jgi:hypothetical protein
MADVTKIVQVAITRETNFPSSDSFGIGAIIAEFIPGNLNTPMQGANGRYKKYVSLNTMVQDGWTESDPIYQAGAAYFGESPRPSNFIVGLRLATDADWDEALDAVQADYANWYGFTCILSATEISTPALFSAAIIEIAEWAEAQIKLFFFSTSQAGSIGELVALSVGYFTSGKPGALANFQAITKGQFAISKDAAAAVTVKDINLSADATAGQWETGSVAGNLANFQAISDGEFSLALDGAAADDVAGIDTTVATNFASVASIIQVAVRAVAGLELVSVTYDSSVNKILFTSGTTGAASAVVIAIAGAPSGTDFTLADYLNGGESEPGQAGGVLADYDAVATAIQTAITSAGVTGITVAYDSIGLRFTFASDTTGNASSVELTAVTDESGQDLTGVDYFNGGIITYGTDAGATPGTDDIGSVLKSQYDRTSWWYHESARDAAHVAVADVVWLEMALMSQLFASYKPAEATWAFKNFDDNDEITVSEITDVQDEFVRDNYGNTYTLTGGSNVTLDGKVCGGEYIDIMRGTDWLQAELVAGAYKPLVDNAKIPYTDGGIGLEENAIRGVLTKAEVNLLNAEDTELTVPKEADATKEDKAARDLPGFEFSATYQGAIQKVGIAGTIGL